MILKRSERKNPLKQAQYAVRKFDWAPVGYVTICVLISAVWGYFDVITWFDLYTGRDAEALAALAGLCHLAALVSTLYINWRLPQSKLAGVVLIAGFLVFSGFNVFGGTQFVMHAAEEIEQARWVKAQFELDAKRAKAQEAVEEAAARLPAPCDKKSPTFTACRELYKAEFQIAKESGDVARYDAAANKLADIPERAPRKPPYPWELIALGFAFLSLVMLTGPWAAGFGRQAPEPQAPLNPIPDGKSPPDGEAKPHLPPVTPQEVGQNVPPPVPLKSGYPPYQIHPPVAPRDAAPPEIASIEERVRAALRTPGADGKMPSVNEVAKALGPEIKRWRVQQIAAEMRGAA